MAIQICDLTAFSEVPKKALIRRCCLIHLKKSSTCQRQRYSSVIVSAGKTKLLVRKMRVLAVSGSLKRIRRSGASRARRWHWPACCEPPPNESRDDTAWNFVHAGILRCPEGSPDRSTVRRPCTGTDPGTRRTSL